MLRLTVDIKIVDIKECEGEEGLCEGIKKTHGMVARRADCSDKDRGSVACYLKGGMDQYYVFVML